MKTIHSSSPAPLPPIPIPNSPSLRALRRASLTPSASPRSPRYAPAKPPRPPSPRHASAARAECTPNVVLRHRSPDPVQRRVAQLLDAYLERALGPVEEEEEPPKEHLNVTAGAPEPSETDTTLSQPSQSEPSPSVSATDSTSGEESAFRLFADSQPGQLVLRKRPAPNMEPSSSPRHVAGDVIISPLKRRKIVEQEMETKRLGTKECGRGGPTSNAKIRARDWGVDDADRSPCKKSRVDNFNIGQVKAEDAQRDSDDSDDDAEEMARLRSVVVSIAPPVVGSGD